MKGVPCAWESPGVFVTPLWGRLTRGTTSKGLLLATFRIIAIAAGDVKEWPASQTT
jgi:hypothetical protein